MADPATAPARTRATAPARATAPPRVVAPPVRTPAAPVAAVAWRPARPVLRLVEPAPPTADAPAVVADVLRWPGEGEALRPGLVDRLEAAFGIDLGHVRVHTDNRARRAATALGARAFVAGRHVFLGERARADDAVLLGHEVAHVLQQRPDGPVGGDMAEREASSAGRTAAGGGTVALSMSAAHRVPQRDEEEPGWLERRLYSLLERVAPDLVPIVRKGIVAWLGEKLSAALDELMDMLLGPVRQIAGIVGDIFGAFRDLGAWIRQARAGLAKGDCSAISEAAAKIQSVLEGLVGPVIDKLKWVFEKVKGFFTVLWDRFGAPAWEFLKRIGGAVWRGIESLATGLWELTRPVRDWLSRAWKWLKGKLGIGEGGPEGQNGLLNWFKEKASEAWDAIKAKIEPYKKQLMVVVGVIVMLSPVGPIVAIAAAGWGLIKGLRWLAANMRRGGDAVIADRGALEGTILPALMAAVDSLSSAVNRAAGWLTERLGEVTSALGDAVGMLAGGALRFLVGAVQWLLDRFKELATWATEGFQALAGLVEAAIRRLRQLLEPVLRVVRWIGRIVSNVLEIVGLVAERAWNLIPACIRDPIVRFLTERILAKVPFFSSLVKIPDIWTQLRAFARTVIRQIFRDGDLAGAVMTVFKFLLKVLKVPIDLVQRVFRKAAAAMDKILDDPIGFLKSLLRALRAGLGQFFGNIGRHLLAGIGGWLADQIADAGVAPPADYSLGSIFKMVLQILGITLEKVWTALKKKIDPPIVDRLRKGVDVLTGVFSFVADLIKGDAASFAKHVMEKLGDLWGAVRDAIIGWLTDTIIARVTAKLLSMLDPTGVMAVVNAIIALWNAIESAIEYLRRILEIIERFLDMIGDLAAGIIQGAADRLEGLFAKAIPIAIGFLANQLGLSRLGKRLREMIAKVQEIVDKAIDWLVDRAVRLGQSVLRMLGMGKSAAVAGDVDYPEEKFTADDGEEHRLFWRKEAGGHVATVSTDQPRDVIGYLGQLKSETTDAKRIALIEATVALLKKATGLSADIDKTGLSDAEKQKKRATLTSDDHTIAANLKKILAKKSLAKLKEKYLFEGQTGPYSALKGITGTGDVMEADHQPQKAVVSAASSLMDGNRLVFANTMIRTYAEGDMVAINLHKRRHIAGRTYGGKSAAVLTAAKLKFKTALTAGGVAQQIAAVLKVLLEEAEADAKHVKGAITQAKAARDTDALWDDVRALEPETDDRNKLIDAIADQIEAGEKKIVQQDFERLGR
jgi:phage-related protein